MAAAAEKLVRDVRPGRTVKAKAKARTQPGRPARHRRRKPVQGATRNVATAEVRPPKSFAWLNRILVLLGAGIVLIAATKAYITVQSFPVQRISVSGELEHTQAELVQDMVQASLAGGFLRADLQLMRQQLESLPWIFEATVRRKWPNALEIHVVEQLPIARWGEDGFLNHEGGIFNTARDSDWESLPLLEGPEGSAPALMARYLRLLEILAPVNLSVEQLSVDDRGQIEAVLVGGTRLILGSEKFLERMHRFVAVYRKELAPRQLEIERVDLRYQSGVAVAFSEPSQVAGL